MLYLFRICTKDLYNIYWMSKKEIMKNIITWKYNYGVKGAMIVFIAFEVKCLVFSCANIYMDRFEFLLIYPYSAFVYLRNWVNYIESIGHMSDIYLRWSLMKLLWWEFVWHIWWWWSLTNVFWSFRSVWWFNKGA